MKIPLLKGGEDEHALSVIVERELGTWTLQCTGLLGQERPVDDKTASDGLRPRNKCCMLR